MREERCEDCKYWDEVLPNELGFCKINPPTVNPAEPIELKRYLTPIWPPTEASDWCGQFKKRE